MITRMTTALLSAAGLALACAAVSIAGAPTRTNAPRSDGRSPVIVLTAGGFDWTDAGIGAAAGFGLATIAAAALALTRKSFAAS